MVAEPTASGVALRAAALRLASRRPAAQTLAHVHLADHRAAAGVAATAAAWAH